MASRATNPFSRDPKQNGDTRESALVKPLGVGKSMDQKNDTPKPSDKGATSKTIRLPKSGTVITSTKRPDGSHSVTSQKQKTTQVKDSNGTYPHTIVSNKKVHKNTKAT